MKLLRFEEKGYPRIGVLRGNEIVSLRALDDRFPTMLTLIAGGPEALEVVQRVVDNEPASLTLSEARLFAPIERPGKYLAIGMNYRKHAEESVKAGFTTQSRQMWFNKQTSCISGPFDDIDPGVSENVDYEVELGAVIGSAAKEITRADASKHVFGYFVANDVSARDWQRHSPTFTLGKSFDTHGPIGPWITTADEVLDPHALKLRCFVNGEIRQESDTGQMIFDLWEQISYLSTALTLESGDLLATGTPEGVGMGMQPPRYLSAGDRIRCEVEGLGAIENVVKRLRGSKPW